MTHTEKIFAVVGKIGRIKASKRFDMTYPTFLNRLNNPGEWRMTDIEVIDRLYNEIFLGPAKQEA